MRKPKKWQSLRDWYLDHFPDDDLGLEISHDATFDGLFEILDCYRDVYEYIGVGDSVIRERLFEGLAKYIGSDYDYIYDQWMKGA